MQESFYSTKSITLKFAIDLGQTTIELFVKFGNTVLKANHGVRPTFSRVQVSNFCVDASISKL